MKLDSYDLKVMDEVEDFLKTNFQIKKYPERNDGYIEHDDLISMIEEMLFKLKNKKENYENDYPNEERDREREILEI